MLRFAWAVEHNNQKTTTKHSGFAILVIALIRQLGIWFT
jgi:hypothetical protein